ncbi:hypothetical protein Q5M85_10565 [Paraclostridium bifermentans]|nr:hypothetical protein [Paraclostridium bifermentans]
MCPFGFLQDLLYKIKTPKLKIKIKLMSLWERFIRCLIN